MTNDKTQDIERPGVLDQSARVMLGLVVMPGYTFLSVTTLVHLARP